MVERRVTGTLLPDLAKQPTVGKGRHAVLAVYSWQRKALFPVPTFILSGAPPKLTKGHSVTRKFVRAQPVPKSCPSCAQPENVGPVSEEF